MSHNTYNLGDLLIVSGAFTANSVAIDPDGVFITVRDPEGTITTLEYGVDLAVVKDSVGNYHTTIDVNLCGRWRYRWWSTGYGQASTPDVHFEVPETLAVDP